jgi:hypothetical protein
MAWLISKALMTAYENSLFSQAQVAESSEATCSGGEPSAPSSGNHTPQAYLSPDKMTAFSRLSRFGMTFAPFPGDRGEDLLTWYLADFHARTYQSQEPAQESTENVADSGQKWPASLARYDPATHSLKTAQLSLLGDLIECSVTLPRSGTMRSGMCYQRPILGPIMSVTASGASQEMFPTPTVCGDYNRKGASKTSGDGLATYIRKYPTPCARDYKGARTDGAMALTGRNQATNSLPDYLASIGQRGRMNPEFREWLMGWPLGWTGLKPLETARFHEWLRQHSPYSASAQDGDA